MKFTFAPEATPLAGYTIKRAIDRGGFGEVYYALSDSGKEVALKLLQRNQQVELRGVRQCLNLKHPNLVTIFDIRTDADEDHWVVMEYVAGKSLEQVIHENPRGLPLEEVEAWLSGIAAGIGFLHDRGIVHRDLKPANVFRENGVVKIGDVGLSKFITLSRRSAQTESVGTVYYMAPEVARGKYGSELDIYSLGIMLFELLTGQVPFDGESTGEILMKHLTEPPDLSRIAPQLRTVLARALEKDPQRRTPGAVLLAEEFRRAIQGRPAVEESPARQFIGSGRAEAPVTFGLPPVAEPTPANSFGEAQPGQSAHAATAHFPAAAGANPPVGGVNGSSLAGKIKSGFQILIDEAGRDKALLVSLILLLLMVTPALVGFAAVTPAAWLLGSVSLGGLLFPAAFLYMCYWYIKKGRHLSARPVMGSGRGHSRDLAGAPLAPAAQVPVGPRVVMPPPGPLAPPRGVAPHAAPENANASNPAANKASARRLTPDAHRQIPLRTRLAALSLSMTFAVLWSLAITVLLAATAPEWFAGPDTNVTFPIRAGFFALTTILAAWAILVPSKFFEGRGRETSRQRLIATAMGGAVGACAWWLSQELFVALPFTSEFPGLFDHVLQFPLLTANRTPALAGYVVFFAALFGLRRWWSQADGFRPNRLRIRSLVWSGVVAFFVPALFVFPQSSGVIWSLAISAVVQLSSPWIPLKERAERVRNS
jgi:hypothetical protein